jgi:hypothetical protein
VTTLRELTESGGVDWAVLDGLPEPALWLERLMAYSQGAYAANTMRDALETDLPWVDAAVDGALERATPRIRRDMAQELVRLGDGKRCARLLREDPDALVRYGLLEHIQTLDVGPMRDAVVDAARSDSAPQVRGLAISLSGSGVDQGLVATEAVVVWHAAGTGAGSVAALEVAAAHPDPFARAQALRALAASDPAAAHRLAQPGDPDPTREVVPATIRALARRAATASEALEQATLANGREAWQTVSSVPLNKNTRAWLLAAIGHPDQVVRRAVFLQIGKRKEVEVVDALIGAARAGCVAAASALGHPWKGDTVAPVMARLGLDPRVRVAMVYKLADIVFRKKALRGDADILALMRAAVRERGDAQLQAAQAIQSMKAAAAVPDLQHALRGAIVEARRYPKGALDGGGPMAVGVILEGLCRIGGVSVLPDLQAAVDAGFGPALPYVLPDALGAALTGL